MKSLLHLICAEIRSAVSAEVKIVSDAVVIPSRPIFETISVIQEMFCQGYSTCLLGYIGGTSGSLITCIEVSTQGRSTRHSDVYELECFKSIRESTEDSPYADRLLSQLSAGRRYLQVGNVFNMLHPSVGTYTKVKGRPSLAVCTPCYKRTDLLKIYYAYMQKYFMPQIIWAGFDVCLIFCGGEEELKAVRGSSRDDNVIFLHAPNNLGQKKNLMFERARDLEFDYVTTIDSDDFVHPTTTLHLIQVASDNGYWSAAEPFYFHDLITGAAGVFEGYASGHQLHGWGMGSARVFSQSALRALGSQPFKSGNKGMDDGMKKRLATWDIEVNDRLVSTDTFKELALPLPIGAKSDVNVWGIRDYKLNVRYREEFNTDWLLPDIKSALLNLQSRD